MEKFFYPDETYDRAIRNKDAGVLRALLTGIIGSDPTFVTSEFDEAQAYIRDKSIELNGEEFVLNEDFKRQEDEVEKTIEGEWDEHYFQMNLVWLRDNFNLANRLPKIKKIGAVVYKNKKTLGKSKIENRKRSLSDAKTEKEGQPETKKAQSSRTSGGGSSEKKRGFYGKIGRFYGRMIEWINNYWWLGLIILAIVGFVFFGGLNWLAKIKIWNK